MPAPDCPNCREPLAYEEAGQAGLWNCLYCDGIWLTWGQIVGLARTFDVKTEVRPDTATAEDCAANATQLRCATCSDATLRLFSLSQPNLANCSECGGAFLRKDAAESFRKKLTGPRGIKELSWEPHAQQAIGYGAADVALNAAAAILAVLLS